MGKDNISAGAMVLNCPLRSRSADIIEPIFSDNAWEPLKPKGTTLTTVGLSTPSTMGITNSARVIRLQVMPKNTNTKVTKSLTVLNPVVERVT